MPEQPELSIERSSFAIDHIEGVGIAFIFPGAPISLVPYATAAKLVNKLIEFLPLQEA